MAPKVPWVCLESAQARAYRRVHRRFSQTVVRRHAEFDELQPDESEFGIHAIVPSRIRKRTNKVVVVI
jgi:hypothetical protein